MLREDNLYNVHDEKNEHVEKWQARRHVEKFNPELGFQKKQNGLYNNRVTIQGSEIR